MGNVLPRSGWKGLESGIQDPKQIIFKRSNNIKILIFRVKAKAKKTEAAFFAAANKKPETEAKVEVRAKKTEVKKDGTKEAFFTPARRIL